MKELSKESVIKFVGIDLAKRSFHLYAVDGEGRAVLSRKVTRARLSGVVAQLPACTIAMEACGSAHHWARLFRTFGHEVRLIAPQFVKPYVKSNNTNVAIVAMAYKMARVAYAVMTTGKHYDPAIGTVATH